MRLLRERSGARVPSCFIAGEGTRQCAGQARVTMALFAAPRPVLTPCCSAFWGPDPPPPDRSHRDTLADGSGQC